MQRSLDWHLSAWSYVINYKYQFLFFFFFCCIINTPKIIIIIIVSKTFSLIASINNY